MRHLRARQNSYVLEVADITVFGQVGEPVQLDGGTAAIDAASVAKGAAGTTAVTWRKIGGGGKVSIGLNIRATDGTDNSALRPALRRLK